MKRKCLTVAILIVVTSVLCSISFAEKGPEHHGKRSKIRSIIKSIFPSGKVKKVESEDVTIKATEIDLVQDGKECSINITEDGIVLSTEVEVDHKDLPEAVANAIKQKIGDAKITKIEREEIRAVVKVVKLKKPVNVYEAKFIKDGKVFEIKVASDGKVLAVEADDDDDKDGDRKAHKAKSKVKDDDQKGRKDKDDDDDDEESEEVSIKDVPEKVRAAINKISKGGKVEEIEREKEDGKVVFEVKVEYGEKEIEFKIAPNGKIISKRADHARAGRDPKKISLKAAPQACLSCHTLRFMKVGDEDDDDNGDDDDDDGDDDDGDDDDDDK